MTKQLLKSLAFAAVAFFSLNSSAYAESYKVAWSHYTGWEAWGYIEESGIMDKWAEKYGIDVEVVLVNDYIESINLYTAGEFDGVTATNMDALTIPAIGGVDSSAIIIGDYSDGNDAIVAQSADNIAGLKGLEVKLVELSVSHYLLARALDQNGLSERDLTLVNTSDADIGGLFMSDPAANVVTWNPIVNEIKGKEGAKILFDSSSIPGEILDVMIVHTDADEKLKKALVGAWYEAMTHMNGEAGDEQKAEALGFMAQQAGGTLGQFEEQLKTTAMFYTPAKAIEYARPELLKETMDYVRNFSFNKGLYAQGMDSADAVGIELPDASILGDTNNIRLRFDNSYMEMAAEGQL
mgnify:CR=1 FL=1